MAASPSVSDCSTGRMGAVRFVILGAGAVGGTVGGLLHDSGHDVVLVARGAHAAGMRTDGLRLATPDRVITAHVEVVDDPTALKLRDDDMLVVTTKTQDTTALLDIVAGLTVNGASAAAVLPLFCVQNGVANERIAARRFADVHGCRCHAARGVARPRPDRGAGGAVQRSPRCRSVAAWHHGRGRDAGRGVHREQLPVARDA